MSGLQRSLLLALVGIICLFTIAQAYNVELYENKHFRGKHMSIDVRGCTNLPIEWEDETSSIEPSQCVLIFKHPMCQGPRIRLEPYGFGTAYLREINFEDKISSLAPCNFSPTKDRDPTKERVDF